MKTLVNVLLFMLYIISCCLFFSCSSDNPVIPGDEYTITGQITGNDNFPLNNVKVEIGGKIYTTGPDGKFSFYSVKYPYDLIIRDSVNKYYEIYDSIASNNLVVNLPVNSNTTYQSNIIVNYPDTTYAYSRRFVIFDDNYGIYKVFELYGATHSEFPVTLPSNTSLNLRAVIITFDRVPSSGSTDYKLYAAKNAVDIYNKPGNIEITFSNSDFKSLSSQFISGTLSAPQYVFGGYYYINFSNIRIQSLLYTYRDKDIAVPGTLLADVPIGIPDRFLNQFYIHGSSDNKEINFYYVPPGSGSIAANCPDVFDVLSPQDNAMDVDSNTVFSVNPTTNNIFRFSLIDTVINSTYSFCTSKKNIMINNMRQIISNLTSGRMYKYEIEKTGIGYESVGVFLINGKNPQHYSGKVKNRHFTAK